MKGISYIKAKQNSIKYREMYDKWQTENDTLQQIGKEYGITKQRVWQIVTRCKLGDGDYYVGVNIARDKWLEYIEAFSMKDAKKAYERWLEDQDIKIAADNRKVAPHTGWEYYKYDSKDS